VTGVVEEPAEIFVVLVRRRSVFEWARDLLGRAPHEVLESEAPARRV
jgi:hypothetical protein